MDTRHAADDGHVVNLHLAGKLDGVGHDHLVAHAAAVRHMHIGHDQALLADARDLAVARAGMYRGKLAQCGAIADLGIGCAAGILQILCLHADAGKREEAAIAADARVAVNDNMGLHLGVVAELDMLADDGIGADDDILAKLGAGMHDRGRMYGCHV